MADARRELEGETAAFIVQMIPVGVWVPNELAKMRNLNPYRKRAPESEALKAHKKQWESLRWSAWAGGV